MAVSRWFRCLKNGIQKGGSLLLYRKKSKIKIQSGPKVGLHCVSVSRKGFQGLTIDNTVTYLIHLVICENNSPSPAPIQ